MKKTLLRRLSNKRRRIRKTQDNAIKIFEDQTQLKVKNPEDSFTSKNCERIKSYRINAYILQFQ